MIRKEWDEIETSLLIEAYIKITENGENKEICLTELSNSLRFLAIKQGIKIDEDYRNYNGMQWQMGYVRNAFIGHKSPREPAKIFVKMVDMYKNDKPKFELILNKAHALVAKKAEVTVDKKKEFIKWVAQDKIKGLSSEELSEILEDAFFTYEDCNLWGIKDPNQFNSLRNKISSNQKYKKANKKEYKAFISYSKFYRTFLENINKNETPIEQEKETKKYTVSMKEADFYSYLKDFYQKKTNNSYTADASKYAQYHIDAIRELNDFLNNSDCEYKNLFDVNTVDGIKVIEKTIPRYKSRLTEYDLNNFKMVLTQYWSFILDLQNLDKQKFINSNTVKSKNDYFDVLSSCFSDGFLYENPLRKRRFIKEYEAINRKAFSDSEENYKKKLREIGFENEGMIYLPSIVPEETKNEIEKKIDGYISNNPYMVFYSCLLDQYSDKLNKLFGIGMLKEYLKCVFRDKYIFEEKYITSKKESANLKQSIINIFLNVRTPLEVNELQRRLPSISVEAIDDVLNEKEFAVNYRGRSYFYKDIFYITEGHINEIKKYIYETIQKKEQVSGDELYSFIEKNIPELIEINEGFTKLGVKNAIKHKLNHLFNFSGDVICDLEQNIDVKKLYKDFCLQRESFTFEELEDFRNTIHKTYIDYYVIFDNSIRISRDKYIRKDQIVFDIEKTDSAISKYCLKGYSSFAEISNFIDFPPTQYIWNNYMLESYLYNISSKYRLVHASFNSEKPVGAIVEATSKFTDFDKLLLNVIKENKLFDKEKAQNFLLENDYIFTKKYKNLDLLIEQAKKERSDK